jgi:hypothetical protein
LPKVLEADHGLPSERVVQLAVDLRQPEHGAPERHDRSGRRRPDVAHQAPDLGRVGNEVVLARQLRDGSGRRHVEGAEAVRRRPKRVQTHHDARATRVEVWRVVDAVR